MVFLVICKNKEELIKNEGARVVTTLFIDFSGAQGQLTPKSVMESCKNSKLIQAFIVGLVTYKNENGPSKNEGTRVVTIVFPVISLWGLFQTLKGSLLRTDPRCYGCPRYLQE